MYRVVVICHEYLFAGREICEGLGACWPTYVVTYFELVVEAAVDIEDLDALAVFLGQRIALSRRRRGDRLRIVVFPSAGARRPEPAGERAVGIKELDAGIAVVDHYDTVTRRRPVDVFGTSNLPFAIATRPEREEKGAVVRAEYLDAVVVAVCHGDARAVGRKRDGVRNCKRPAGGAASRRPERVGRRAVGMKDAHNRVAAARHGQQAARRGIIYGIRLRTAHGKRVVKGAVGMEDIYAFVAQDVHGHGERAPPGLMGGRGGGRRRSRLHCSGRQGRDEPRRGGRRLGCAGGQTVFGSHGAGCAGQPIKPWIRRRGQRGGQLHVTDLPDAGGKRSEGVHEAAAGIEHLHAVVAGVRHGDQVAVRGQGNGSRVVKHTLARALRAERKYKVGANVEYLHTVVAGVGNDNRVVIGHGDALRRRQISNARALRAEREHGRAVDAEGLHAVVAGVGDDNRVVAGDGNAARRRQIPNTRALRAEYEGGRAVGIEYLHAVVARVGDGDHAARRQEGDRARAVELPRLAAARPELACERAVCVKDLDAVVARVGDGDRAVGADGDAPRRRKVPATRALRAEYEGGRAVGIEYQYAVVARVGHGEHAALKHGRAGLGMSRGKRGQQARGGDSREQYDL